MDLTRFFPIWDHLTPAEQMHLERSVVPRTASKGTLLHNGSNDCVGLFMIRRGQLRAFLLSPEGKEITLYRLVPGDICLFSASCMFSSIQFDLSISAEQDTDLWLIPTQVYQTLMKSSAVVANYTNQIMAARFSEVMWLMEQVLWSRFDQRLAQFLLNEYNLIGSPVLRITHEQIASHLGSAREVVSRMLKYFQSDRLVTLSRGTVTLIDCRRLAQLS